ncbi:hypothetical protein WG66_002097 [Moniliophthora roreri]|nr:hypothetical protein WG66_002097 [Moniliophthora roreri]
MTVARDMRMESNGHLGKLGFGSFLGFDSNGNLKVNVQNVLYAVASGKRTSTTVTRYPDLVFRSFSVALTCQNAQWDVTLSGVT